MNSEHRYWISFWSVMSASFVLLVGLTDGCRKRDTEKDAEIVLHCLAAGHEPARCGIRIVSP